MRKREDLVTRFFAYGDGLEGYKDRPADFLFKYCKRMNECFAKNSKQIQEYRDRFSSTLSFIDRVFPFGFRKTNSAKETFNVRFEAIAIGSYLAIAENPKLAQQTPGVEGWLTGDEFKKHTKSGGSNVIRLLENRLYFVRDMLLGK